MSMCARHYANYLSRQLSKTITLVLQEEDRNPDNLWYISQYQLEHSEGGDREELISPTLREL